MLMIMTTLWFMLIAVLDVLFEYNANVAQAFLELEQKHASLQQTEIPFVASARSAFRTKESARVVMVSSD